MIKQFSSSKIENPSAKQFADNYPYFYTNCAYQVFDDLKQSGCSGGRMIGMRKFISQSNIVKRLVAENKKGKGVFFSYNAMDSPDRRGNNYVMKIVARVAEIDAKHGQEKEQQLLHINNLACPPSCMVESKNGYHCYRFSDDSATKDNWNRICQNITAHIGGDPNAPKLGGVFRIPGFYHNKDPSDPFMVKCIYIDSGLVYSEQEMLNAFRDTKKNCYKEFSKHIRNDVFNSYRKKNLTSYVTTSQMRETLYKHLSKLDNRDMLNLLSGTWLVKHERFSFKSNADGTEQIIVDGTLTSCWIDRSRNIGSSDGGGPTWIQRVLWYKTCNYQELVTYIKEHHSYLFHNN